MPQVSTAFSVLMNLYWMLLVIFDTVLFPMAAKVLRFVVIPLSMIMTAPTTNRRGGQIVRGSA